MLDHHIEIWVEILIQYDLKKIDNIKNKSSKTFKKIN
jgi:hypothetical protein